MTREEKQEKARIDRILAKGPIDLPFALLVVLLTAIGVLMVFSASFARGHGDRAQIGHAQAAVLQKGFCHGQQCAAVGQAYVLKAAP